VTAPGPAGRPMGPRRAWLGRPVPGAEPAEGIDAGTADVVHVAGADAGQLDEAARLVAPSGQVVVVVPGGDDPAALEQAVELVAARLELRALDAVDDGIALTAAPRPPGAPVPDDAFPRALLLQLARTAALVALVEAQDRGITVRDQAAADLERDVAAARQESSRLAADLEAARDEARVARDAAREESSRLAGELDAARDEARQDSSRLATELDAVRDEARVARDAAREESSRLAAELDAARDDARVARDESSRLTTERDAARDDARVARDESSRLTTERDAARDEARALTADLAAAEQAHAELSAEHEVVLDRLAMRAAQVEELRSSRTYRLARLVWRLRRPFARQRDSSTA
jgi:YD repeat-containing protein